MNLHVELGAHNLEYLQGQSTNVPLRIVYCGIILHYYRNLILKTLFPFKCPFGQNDHSVWLKKHTSLGPKIHLLETTIHYHYSLWHNHSQISMCLEYI